ncbi:MAG TPA: glycosyltransferase family 39 protein [Vicinamibacterales bacterium]|nr:glycosyltransferase family 39 protein [Vicinamibacterales bacterium]
MPALSIPSPRPATWDGASADALTLPWARAKVIVLVCSVLIAATVRITALDTYGFSEDEINKVEAIEQYRAGHFGANAEHPMLMKLAMWASVGVADRWNRVAPPEAAISPETAVRLPNALAGAATTAVLFGVADMLFGGSVAAATALIWALDVNAIGINRIGKEDTFLLLFFLLAVFCYERAKQQGVADVTGAQRWYTASGASFGLMLASKYMPHYLGMYALFNLLTDPEPGENKPHRLRHYAAMAVAFVTADLAILLPSTWQYMASYVRGTMLAHHGYAYAGALYVTNVPISPLGVPVTFYLRLLATKVPIVALAALVPGVIEMIRRRHERGFVLLRVLAVFVIVPYSLMAAKFLRYSLPMLATIDVIAAVGIVAGLGWLLRKNWLPLAARISVAIAAVAVFAVGLIRAQQAAAPFYSLFENVVGARVNVARPAFPEDTYDYGVREAVAGIVSVAAPSAQIVSDAPAVVAHYVREQSRPDIRVRSLSMDGLDVHARESWAIVQDEHLTFENEAVVSQLRARETPWREIRIDERVVAQIFRLPE